MNANLILRLCLMRVPQLPLKVSIESRLTHDQTKHVWCRKTESAKHTTSKLGLISHDQAWSAFTRHTVALEDQRMRDRINCLLDYAPDQPYVLEIRYHRKCWLKYVRSYKNTCEDGKLLRMHNVTHDIFFYYIRTVTFEEHAQRALHNLFRVYNFRVYISFSA